MPEFTFTGSETFVFPSLATADGSTLVCQPGDNVNLDFDPQTPLLEAIAGKGTAPTTSSAPANVVSQVTTDAPQTPSDAPTTPAPSA